MKNLDGVVMYVSRTAADGVVGAGTRLYFRQWGRRVLARYAGGRVDRGVLVGRVSAAGLRMRFVQRESDGAIHAGHSWCAVVDHGHRVRMLEHFAWDTREGTGTNVFDEIDAPPAHDVGVPQRGRSGGGESVPHSRGRSAEPM